MKILFLDFDGVLNNKDHKGLGSPTLGTITWCAEQLDPSKVLLLNEILKATEALVVLTTSWREHHPQHKLEVVLKKRGFQGAIASCTPLLGDRTDEIQTWLTMAGPDVEALCILDDIDMGHLNPYLVRTSWGVGLQPEHVKQAIQLLTQKS